MPIRNALNEEPPRALSQTVGRTSSGRYYLALDNNPNRIDLRNNNFLYSMQDEFLTNNPEFVIPNPSNIFLSNPSEYIRRSRLFMPNNTARQFVILPTDPQLLHEVRIYNRITNRYLFQVFDIESGQVKLWQIGQRIVDQLQIYISNNQILSNFRNIRTLPIWSYSLDLSMPFYNQRISMNVNDFLSDRDCVLISQNIINLRELAEPIRDYFNSLHTDIPLVSDISQSRRRPPRPSPAPPTQYTRTTISPYQRMSPLEREYLERINK